MLANRTPARRRLPIRRILRWTTPDVRRPWFKDYILDCGHILVHRPLRRGPDGRLHIAHRVSCPLCHSLPLSRELAPSRRWHVDPAPI
ncbi:MAG: hypothetical protein AAB263_10440 [Planctomycetota bacterium]